MTAPNPSAAASAPHDDAPATASTAPPTSRGGGRRIRKKKRKIKPKPLVLSSARHGRAWPSAGTPPKKAWIASASNRTTSFAASSPLPPPRSGAPRGSSSSVPVYCHAIATTALPCPHPASGSARPLLWLDEVLVISRIYIIGYGDSRLATFPSACTGALHVSSAETEGKITQDLS
ncbi:unnamed protein product [Urochloa humidicola]